MSAHNRTWLCCVAFLDVVGFTKHHMQAQLAIKAHLDAQLQHALLHHSKDDYILLDRGDGAAVCFLVEPEAALYFSLNLRDAVRAQEDCAVAYEIRTGINLGPIKIILDVNGDKTTLGEGINCAARIMDFAGAGQIFVSRSFYEVIGCLSQEYAELFSYLGKRADKHVREFEVYEVAAARSHIEVPKTDVAAKVMPTERLRWDDEALQSRVVRLSDELGPMARILVQQAMLKANSLEELDQILDKPYFQSVSDQDDSPIPESNFDSAFLKNAEHLLSEVLGPIAALLIKRAAASASDHASLCNLLAKELGNDLERQTFLSKLGHER